MLEWILRVGKMPAAYCGLLIYSDLHGWKGTIAMELDRQEGKDCWWTIIVFIEKLKVLGISNRFCSSGHELLHLVYLLKLKWQALVSAKGQTSEHPSPPPHLDPIRRHCVRHFFALLIFLYFDTFWHDAKQSAGEVGSLGPRCSMCLTFYINFCLLSSENRAGETASRL